ncbi:hypothetical protein QJS10_CPA10g01728 [Acorus calamus]|uniref:Uncharacterized protein n=1 Tax=Acorus calamus TaxID=4465 RepID=A0AAV9E1I1_ACOCL|nr:hypothetical protein QJS10_CPA10g01728 [Acorus calamus]
MGGGRRMGEVVFKGLTASLGVATLYLAATFSVNVYRGLSWHNSQTGVYGAQRILLGEELTDMKGLALKDNDMFNECHGQLVLNNFRRTESACLMFACSWDLNTSAIT